MKLSIKISLYIITLFFTLLSLFCQVAPLEGYDYFYQVISVSSPSDFVYLVSTFFITYSIMQLPGGILLDKYGVKFVVPIALFITLCGVALYWYSGNKFELVTGRLLTGIGCSVAYVSAVYVASKFFPLAVLPLLIGLIEGGSTAGSIVATSPLQNALNVLGWDSTGVIVCVFTATLMLGSLALSRFIPDKKGLKTHSLTQLTIDAFKLFTNKKLLLIFLYSLCTWLIVMSFPGYWLKDYLIHVHSYQVEKALTYINYYWVSLLLASLLLGCIVHNLTIARWALVLSAGIGFAAYIYLATPTVLGDLKIIFILIVSGASAAGVVIAFSLIPYFTQSDSCGSALALNNTFVVFGGYLGQILFGFVLDHYNITNQVNFITEEQLLANSTYYSAMLIYLLFSGVALVLAGRLFFITKRLTVNQSANC